MRRVFYYVHTVLAEKVVVLNSKERVVGATALPATSTGTHISLVIEVEKPLDNNAE